MVLPASIDPLESALAQARARRRLPEPSVRRMLRERAGVTQATVAAACGVSRAEVSRWESGGRTPRGEALDKYLAVLDRLAAAAVGARA